MHTEAQNNRRPRRCAGGPTPACTLAAAAARGQPALVEGDASGHPPNSSWPSTTPSSARAVFPRGAQQGSKAARQQGSKAARRQGCAFASVHAAPHKTHPPRTRTSRRTRHGATHGRRTLMRAPNMEPLVSTSVPHALAKTLPPSTASLWMCAVMAASPPSRARNAAAKHGVGSQMSHRVSHGSRRCVGLVRQTPACSGGGHHLPHCVAHAHAHGCRGCTWEGGVHLPAAGTAA